MSEPDWKTELRRTVGAQIDPWIEHDWQEDALLGALLPHIDAAYQRGLQAGRSQAGYKTTRKKKENDPWPTVTAGAAGPTPASITEPTLKSTEEPRS